VEHDLWRQWQALAAQWAPAAPPGAVRGGARAFAPWADAAERFTAAARSLVQGTAQASAPAAAEAVRTFSDFLREQFAEAFQLPGGQAFGAAMSAPPTFGMDLPALGPAREHFQRGQRATEAWQRTEDAQRRLQRLWSDALRDAAQDFAAQLTPPQPGAVSPEALHALYDQWIDCAEEAYARTAHSDAFCTALADFVNASSQSRRAMQSIIEQWAKLLDLPTRNEINTLSQRLKSVEAELRAARNERKPDAAVKTPRTRRKPKP
jgi:class III poly(R)-hydroxyalkanoic acid synthase PhaE subunit